MLRVNALLIAAAVAVAFTAPAHAAPVPVTFYVMSKCPDAATCGLTFGPALKQLGSAVNLTFSYIASDTGSGFSCMHGDSECKGDMQQLCVQKNYGVNELVDFLTCQDQSQQLIPYNVDQCASSANVDAQAVKDCAAGEEGQALMRDSVAATTAAGVRVCCTVHVNNRPFCVHNGDWEQCGACGDDKAQCLIDTVCSLASTKPAVCASLLADA